MCSVWALAQDRLCAGNCLCSASAAVAFCVDRVSAGAAMKRSHDDGARATGDGESGTGEHKRHEHHSDGPAAEESDAAFQLRIFDLLRVSD